MGPTAAAALWVVGARVVVLAPPRARAWGAPPAATRCRVPAPPRGWLACMPNMVWALPPSPLRGWCGAGGLPWLAPAQPRGWLVCMLGMGWATLPALGQCGAKALPATPRLHYPRLWGGWLACQTCGGHCWQCCLGGAARGGWAACSPPLACTSATWGAIGPHARHGVGVARGAALGPMWGWGAACCPPMPCTSHTQRVAGLHAKHGVGVACNAILGQCGVGAPCLVWAPLGCCWFG